MRPDPAHPCVHSSLDFLNAGAPVYLCTPYSLASNREEMFHAAIHWQTFIATKGYSGISPIVLGHVMPLPHWSHADWMRFCFPILDACGSVFIPPIAGRWDSRGIAAEVERALRMCKPVVVWGDAAV